MLTGSRYPKLALLATTAILLSACESSGSYRLASVGNVPAGSDTASSGSSGSDGSSGGSSSSSGGTASSSSGGGSSGGTASSGGGSSSSSGGAGALGSNILVTAGNAVIGTAGKTNALGTKANGVVPVVTGTVARVLTKTGQTLVDLGDGNTLVLGKAGGKVGDQLRIDLGSKTVIGAPSGSPLLGVGVLPSPGSGNVATASVGNTVDAAVNLTKPLTATVTGVVTPPATGGAPATNPVGGVVGTATGVVNGVTGGILKPKK